MDALRRAKGEYDSLGRFAKLRVWIIAIFVLDVILTVGWVVAASSPDDQVEAWFQPGFPSNMIVIRYPGRDPVADVELVLDGRYRGVLGTMVPGPNGLQIERDFRDASKERPPASYVPQTLEVRVKGSLQSLPITRGRSTE